MSIDYLDVYRREFAVSTYGGVGAAGERYQWALDMLPDDLRTLIDVGCGRGAFCAMVALAHLDADVVGVDLKRWRGYPSQVQWDHLDLSDTAELETLAHADVITCLDVLEHLDEPHVYPAIKALSQRCEALIVSVSNTSEQGVTGELHLTQRSREWWRQKLGYCGTVTREDVMHDGQTFGFEVVP